MPAVAALGCTLAALATAPAPLQAVRVRHFQLVDHTRSIRLANGRHVPRSLDTIVRYPAAGGRYPLIVFAHGFALTPATYRRLLLAWTSAGYVVAAPAFPLERADAPGGPEESDLVNEPADVSFVIGRLLHLRVLSTKIDPARIVVAGHSDGAEAALAVAYDSRFRDPRIRAAVILSGAALPGMHGFPRNGPPLLAVQGTADPINAPGTTAGYFALARRPKFLLWLVGASHLPPYTDEEPQLDIVERVTIAFLDHYLKGRPLRAFDVAARSPGLTRLVGQP